MTKTRHIFLSGYGALELARNSQIDLETDAYFVTDHQYRDFLKTTSHQKIQKIMRKKIHGTVGAVALDRKGNLAAATSTGGTSNCLPGRIGDSCVIGAGCYADNKTCAVSGTGDGESLISGVVAHTIAMLIELKNISLQDACEIVIHERKKIKGEIGVISIDRDGNFGISFNCPIMKRAWMSSDEDLHVMIQKL
jgi:beta-aspartyl-peptidase (threonine type)